MNFYEILGVTRQSSADDIKKAYRSLAMKYHPDRNPGDATASDKFKKVQEAYETLSDLQKKIRYDAGMPTKARPAPTPPKPAPTPPRPRPPVEKRPEWAKDISDTIWEERNKGFTYADATPPKRDIWGNPIKPSKPNEREPDFKDIFNYESSTAPDLR
jgi:hypothetical protein